ncbi:MAG TPA: ion channel [Isosphaeraceae bacterium]
MVRAFAKSELLVTRICRGQYGPLLTALLVLCVAAPVLTGSVFKGALLDAAMSCIVLTGLYAADPRRRSLVIGFALACITLATHRLIQFVHYEPLHMVHYALIFSVLAYTARTILWAVVRDSRVTLETIKGAVCVYLLIGLTWVYLFVMIDMATPGSFRIAPSAAAAAEGHLLIRQELHRLLYLSFCTLTTLGYGDIVPLRGVAQTACYLEAVVGQIFLTVLVARLVGMHISRPPAVPLPEEPGRI